MKTIRYSQCPVCNHKEFTPQVVCKDYTVSDETFAIEKCNYCQLCFTQDVPDSQAIGRYYQAESYVSHSNTQKGGINRIYHWVRNYMLNQKLQHITKWVGSHPTSLLDIGCGTGYFLHTMEQAGWQVNGIEPDDKARNFGIEQFGLQVSPPDQMKLLKANHFKVITLWHVLEHLHDLKGYWNEFNRLLAVDGLLVIAVPNYQCYDAEHYQENWAAWDVPRHLWHFTPTTLHLLAEQFGYQIIDKKMMPFDSFYVALLSEQYRQNPFKLFAGAWHGFISWFKAVRQVEKSSSIIYFLRRRA